MAEIRRIIREAVPDVTEEWKASRAARGATSRR
jgi:hypothetical protein